MGNEHSRCKYSKGYLCVQTAKPFYNPGEQVTGYIYLRISAPIEARHIDINVEGREKSSWLDEEIKRRDDGTQERISIKRKSSRKIIHFSAPAFTFTTPFLNPGDYTIPFAFNIPGGLPGSMFFKKTEHVKRPTAKVKYSVKTVMHCAHKHDDMKYKQVLIIREPILTNFAEIRQKSENQITTWCCVGQGTSSIESIFNKDTFEPHETCTVRVVVNNSQCNVAMHNMRLAVEQEIELHADGHTFRETYTLISKDEGAVQARHPEPVERILTLNLADIKYHVP
jgi:hypothetical protein